MVICKDTVCDRKKSGIRGKIRKMKTYEDDKSIFMRESKYRISKAWKPISDLQNLEKHTKNAG